MAPASLLGSGWPRLGSSQGNERGSAERHGRALLGLALIKSVPIVMPVPGSIPGNEPGIQIQKSMFGCLDQAHGFQVNPVQFKQAGAERRARHILAQASDDFFGASNWRVHRSSLSGIFC
jgi:hypothetical protein